MINTVTIRHNMETAHRLPCLPGKCMNVHGHSWWCDIQIVGSPDDNFMLIEYGALKKAVRTWIDTHWDHGAMLGKDDSLLPAFQADGSKVFVFGVDTPYPWPTVEAVAQTLFEKVQDILDTDFTTAGCRVLSVKVSETHVNQATATL